jgi:hypothetical protein
LTQLTQCYDDIVTHYDDGSLDYNVITTPYHWFINISLALNLVLLKYYKNAHVHGSGKFVMNTVHTNKIHIRKVAVLFQLSLDGFPFISYLMLRLFVFFTFSKIWCWLQLQNLILMILEYIENCIFITIFWTTIILLWYFHYG